MLNNPKVKLGIKPKFDLWFLILLTVVLWSVASQFIALVLVVIGAGINNASSLLDTALWMRVIVTGLGVYGSVWVIKIYIRNVKDRTLREYKQKQLLSDFIRNEVADGNKFEDADKTAEQIIALLSEKE